MEKTTTKAQSNALALLATLGLAVASTPAKVGGSGARRVGPPLSADEIKILEAVNVAILHVDGASYRIPGDKLDQEKVPSVRAWFRDHAGFIVNPTVGAPQDPARRYLSVRRERNGNGTVLETVYRATGRNQGSKNAKATK